MCFRWFISARGSQREMPDRILSPHFQTQNLHSNMLQQVKSRVISVGNDLQEIILAKIVVVLLLFDNEFQMLQINFHLSIFPCSSLFVNWYLFHFAIVYLFHEEVLFYLTC